MKNGMFTNWISLPVAITLGTMLILQAFPAKAATQQYQFTTTCFNCHGSTNDIRPIDQPFRNVTTGGLLGNHRTHLGATVNPVVCEKCHAGSSTYPTGHMNDQVEMSANLNASPVAAKYSKAAGAQIYFNWTSNQAGMGTCSNVNCHFEAVTPTWGATSFAAPTDCDKCHGAPPSGGGTGAAGSHGKHDTYYAGASQCRKCHTDHPAETTPFAHATSAAHRTIAISLHDPAGVAGGSYSGTGANFLPSQSPTFGACSTIYCHSDGKGNYSNPTWGTAASGACGTCHGAKDIAPPSPASPHAIHVGSGSPYRYSCAKCHSRTAKDTADATTFAVISSHSFHVNKAKDVAFNSFVGAATWNGTTCGTTYCHSIGNTNINSANLPGAYGGSLYATPAWSGTVGCNACHGRSTGNGMPDYINAGTPGSATSNSHAKHVVGSSLACVECHERTTRNGTAIRSTTPSYHVNKTVSDVFFNLSGNSKNGTYNSGTKTCSTTYCHGTGPSVAWGGTTTCATCHDATKTDLGGRHDKHYNSTTVFWNLTGNDSHAGGTYAYGCKNCHPTNLHATGPAGANNDANIATSGVSRITAYTPGGSSTSDARGYKYSVGGSCTTSCHTNGQGGAAVTAVTWTTAPAAGCGTCHNKAGDAAPGWSAPHTRHINTYSTNANLTCNACHAGTASSNTAINGSTGAAQHPNGVKNVQFNAWVNSAATYPNTVTGCANTYCHSSGASLTAPSHAAVTWSGTVTCSSCHSGGTASGPTYATGPSKANSHAKHIAAGYGCNVCHYNTTTDGTTVTTPANHVNKTYDVAQGSGVTFSYSYATPGGTCSTISCHGNNSATWGGTVNCQDCHAGGSDNDVWPPFSSASQVAHVKTAEWTSTGHGAAGSYASGTAGANFGAETKQCEFCHDAAISHNAGANWFRLKNYSTADWGRNGPCMACHASGSGGVTVGSTTRNGTKKVGAYHFGANHGTSNNGGRFCWDCHDGHGDGNAYMIHTQVAKVSDRSTGAPTTAVSTTFTLSSPPTAVWSDYVKDTTFNGICQVCHAGAASPTKVAHFRSDLYDANHNPGTRCTVCHGHGSSVTDAFKPSGNCDLCHGYPPIRRGLAAGTVFAHDNYTSAKFEDYSGGGGAHNIEKHVPATAKASDGWLHCAVCHSNGNMEPSTHTLQTPVVPSKLTIDVKDRRKFDYRRTLGSERYSGTLTDKSGGSNTNSTGSCSNINCHMQPSKKWSSDR